MNPPTDIENWLRTKRVSLWFNWDITDDKEVPLAAAAFQKELESFEQFLWDQKVDAP